MNIQKNNISTFKHTIRVIVEPHYKRLYDTLFSGKRFKYIYLKLATFLATHGISPLLAPSAASTKERWQRQGLDALLPTPKTYIKEDNSIPELFKEVLPYLDKNSPILEIGCNVGRSLNYLYGLGYRNLTGIEIGPKAVELMKATFPDMYNNSRILIGDAPSVIKGFNADEFDLIFCHSVLVNIHPKYNYIFKEMARVSKKFILILENEGSYAAYPRDFKKMFEKQRYKMIVSKIFSEVCSSLAIPFEENHIYKNNTIRLFVKDKSFF